MEAVIDPDHMWTRNETANRLRVSTSTLDRVIATGEIEATRIGRRRVLISEGEIQRYLADR